MAVRPDYLTHLIDLFAGFGAVEARRMFSGAGLYRDGLMIGLVTGDTLYLKTDETNRGDFVAAGMAAFAFDRQGRRMVTSYYEAPAEAFDDPEALARWARSAHEAALRADRAKGGRSKPSRAKGAVRAQAKKASKRGGPKARVARKTRR